MHDFAEFVVVLALGVLGGGFVLTIGIVARNTFKSLHLFRPAHLLYAMALLGSAAALGKAGVFCSSLSCLSQNDPAPRSEWGLDARTLALGKTPAPTAR